MGSDAPNAPRESPDCAGQAKALRAGEPNRETMRERAAHAGPISDDTLVYVIELHAVSPHA